jgi:hypothetical protein
MQYWIKFWDMTGVVEISTTIRDFSRCSVSVTPLQFRHFDPARRAGEKSCADRAHKDLPRSLPASGEFTLSHSTLLMALSEVEGPVEGVEMTGNGRDATPVFWQPIAAGVIMDIFILTLDFMTGRKELSGEVVQ